MTTESVDREEVREIIAKAIDVDVAEVTDETDFVEDLEVDSLMALEIMVLLERRYGVKLDEGKLAEITSIQSAEGLLRDALEKKGA